jgi:DNA-binding transcriptional ArsR family regulator
MTRTRTPQPPPAPPDEFGVYHAIADPTRRRLLDLLSRGPQPVTHLAVRFRVTRPAISKHLAVLRRARLVRERKVGRQRFYQLEPAPLKDVAQWVESYRRFWQGNLERLKRHLEGEAP